jgi:hypothetical protein
MGQPISQRWQPVQNQTKRESITSWSMPKAAMRMTLRASRPSSLLLSIPVNGQPPEQVPQVKQACRWDSERISLKMLFYLRSRRLPKSKVSIRYVLLAGFAGYMVRVVVALTSGRSRTAP